MMGGRGAFLESGGFVGPFLWKSIGTIQGIKILIPKDTRKRTSLPERSNTPDTAYMTLDKDGNFNQLRIFGNDRKPLFDIDTNKVDHIPSLHMHYYSNGERQRIHMPVPRDIMQKYHHVIYHGTPSFVRILTTPVD